MKKIKNRIYFDSWRKINEKLFSAYIACYNKLSKNKDLNPSEELVNALSDFGILGKVTKDAYGSAYIPAREIGIFYEDSDGNYILGETARKFISGDMSYPQYMKNYVINYKALINNKIISPFKIIRDFSLLDFVEKTYTEIFEDCKTFFTDGTEDKLAKDSTKLFLDRATEAGLISLKNKKYKIKNSTVYDLNFTELNITPSQFLERYLGGTKEAHKNYVKEIINTSSLITNSMIKINQSLNQILYGPPGTGKTYSTITKALDIIGVEYESYDEAQELFQNELGKRIEFVTMHQSFSYEDFVQGLKPLKPKEGEGITFDFRNGVFKEICRRASLKKKEYIDIQSDNSKFDFDLVFEFAFKDLIENEEAVTIENGNAPFKIYELNERTLWFETSKETRHARYTLAKKTLKEIYNQGENTIITTGNKGYFDSALVFLNKKAAELQESLKTKLKPDDNRNFVIILDEINRANISRVFGELIALIEKDKRDGKLTATLPSGEPFTVPSNLYIIGTMNTADKSIALVDIALRRRFEFTALYPDTDILKNVLKENEFTEDEIKERVNLLSSINRIIRSKKSVDFEIGHSYFMENDSLINILNKQVLPLLNEYFMYDLRKVKEIIEKTQKDKEGKSIPKTGIVFSEKVWVERGLLEVESIKPSSDQTEEFAVE